MTDRIRINISLLLIISLFLHLIIMTAFFLPDIEGLASFIHKKKDNSLFSGRDIIVNRNQDDVRDLNKNTLLSDRDSTAKGFITQEKGNRWLNNSLDFKLKKGMNKMVSGTAGSAGEKVKNSDRESEIVLRIYKAGSTASTGSGGILDKIAIPDKNDITRKNAIYYSNGGLFSFNTAKFRNFTYFKNMKDKIASYWYPPIFGNAIIGGYSPGSGNVRIKTIPSQQVKLYFIMNRNGDIQKVEIVDSYGNKPLDDSCLDAIKLSKSFGKVPDDLKGEYIVIPFIFGYYTQ